MIRSDYHLHTNFSSDSDATAESMIKKAICLGLEKICITDHMDLDYPKEYGLSFTFDVEEYFHKLNILKAKYHSSIKVLIGIELGLRPDLSSSYSKLIEQYPFDFVIGSTHLLDGMDPYYPSYWENHTSEQGILSYFQSIIDNIATFSNFDVYGHIDYIIRYIPDKTLEFTYQRYQILLDQVLQTILSHNLGIEVNTAGYKYGLHHAHPQEDIIKRYLELGGKIITIGSDGHKPEHMAYDFQRTCKMLQALGVTEYTVFESRKPIQLSL